MAVSGMHMKAAVNSVFQTQIRNIGKKKFEANKRRDAENLKYYQDQCWRVCLVWECSIRGKGSRQKIEQVTNQIIEWLEESSDPFLEIKQ